jgi:hypothetical protein
MAGGAEEDRLPVPSAAVEPQQATTVKKALPCGDYGIEIAGRLVAAVERKSLADLVSSMINGKLRYALGELAALGRAAVVVEDRYSSVFKLDRVRPAVIADGLAELAVRWPGVPIVFAETRQLAEEWTYRYLAAAHAWVLNDLAVAASVNLAAEAELSTRHVDPSTAEVRSWARSTGLAVPDKGRLRPEIWQAWREAHPC